MPLFSCSSWFWQVGKAQGPSARPKKGSPDGPTLTPTLRKDPVLLSLIEVPFWSDPFTFNGSERRTLTGWRTQRSFTCLGNWGHTFDPRTGCPPPTVKKLIAPPLAQSQTSRAPASK